MLFCIQCSEESCATIGYCEVQLLCGYLAVFAGKFVWDIINFHSLFDLEVKIYTIANISQIEYCKDYVSIMNKKKYIKLRGCHPSITNKIVYSYSFYFFIE